MPQDLQGAVNVLPPSVVASTESAFRFDASNRLRAAAGRLGSRILGEGIARIKARTLVACTPCPPRHRRRIVVVVGHRAGGRPDDWLDRRRHRRPEREPMTWRRGDGDRPRRALGTCDRRGRRLHGRRSGARATLSSRRRCQVSRPWRVPVSCGAGCHGNDPDRAADHAPARNGQRGRRGAPDLRAQHCP